MFVDVSVHASVPLSVHSSVHKSMHMSEHMSVRMPGQVHAPLYTPVCISEHMSEHTFLRLPAHGGNISLWACFHNQILLPIMCLSIKYLNSYIHLVARKKLAQGLEQAQDSPLSPYTCLSLHRFTHMISRMPTQKHAHMAKHVHTLMCTIMCRLTRQMGAALAMPDFSGLMRAPSTSANSVQPRALTVMTMRSTSTAMSRIRLWSASLPSPASGAGVWAHHFSTSAQTKTHALVVRHT